VLKEVKGIDPEDKKDFARVMCNLIYGRCYNQIQRDMRTGRNKPQAKASSLSVMATPKPKPKPTPRKASTETHNRRVSKRLRQKLNYEGPAMPLTPVKTPTRGPFIPDTVEVHGVELEVRRNEVMVPEVGQFEAKEVDTDVMPLADIKRKTAEIELRNAIKVGKLMDLKLEVEMEKLKATK
jgi:hypothetical protein